MSGLFEHHYDGPHSFEYREDEEDEEDTPETISLWEAEDRYRVWLDDTYPEVQIAGLTYSVSDILENVDPTAFRCGLNDWIDSEGIEVE